MWTDENGRALLLGARLLALMETLSSVRDGDVAARAIGEGALSGFGVRVAILLRNEVGNDYLSLVGQYGLIPEVIDRLRRPQSSRHPMTLMAEAFRLGYDVTARKHDLLAPYPVTLSLLRQLESAHSTRLVPRVLVLRSEGVVIGTLALALNADGSPAPPEELLNGCRHAISLWMPHQRTFPQVLRPNQVLVTPRQKRILSLAARGVTIAAIASDLGCSQATIKADMSKVYRLLGARSRAELLALARETELLEDDEHGGVVGAKGRDVLSGTSG